MKIITQEQIDALMKLLMDLNIPVQAYSSVQDMFSKLPLETPKK
jgi:type III secretion system FlhB-like substrate exporter